MVGGCAFGTIAALDPGTYEVNVVLSPAVEEGAARSIIETNGENIRGPLRTRDLGMTMAEYRFTHRVGTPAEARAAAAAVFAPYDALRAELLDLVAQGRAMKRIRESDDLADMRRCGETMRALQARVAAARPRVDEIPPDSGRTIAIRGTGLRGALASSPSIPHSRPWS